MWHYGATIEYNRMKLLEYLIQKNNYYIFILTVYSGIVTSCQDITN